MFGCEPGQGLSGAGGGGATLLVGARNVSFGNSSASPKINGSATFSCVIVIVAGGRSGGGPLSPLQLVGLWGTYRQPRVRMPEPGSETRREPSALTVIVPDTSQWPASWSK